MMSEEIEGYTQEEFELMLKLVDMEGIYHLTVANGWRQAPTTPAERLELIKLYGKKRADINVSVLSFNDFDYLEDEK
jgi:hypothetical protein